MYKPNGEETMTKREERRYRKAVAERRIERFRAEPSPTFSAFHAAFSARVASSMETAGAGFSPSS